MFRIGEELEALTVPAGRFVIVVEEVRHVPAPTCAAVPRGTAMPGAGGDSAP